MASPVAINLSSPSTLLTLVLPPSCHKYLPFLRWKHPLLKPPRALPHEFFYYAARRNAAPPTSPARHVSRLEKLNRFALFVQGVIWIPLWLGVFDVGSEGVRIPGTGWKVPVPSPNFGGIWKREEWETLEGRARRRARRRIVVEVVKGDGSTAREYYDPSPKSILERNFETPTFEYLGEVW